MGFMRYDATTTHAIEATGLVKRFGTTTALDGVDLVARPGRVLGVLGPNGAGKTTAVRILATLLRPDGGRATVCGYDVLRDAHQVRQLIGLTGQYASVGAHRGEISRLDQGDRCSPGVTDVTEGGQRGAGLGLGLRRAAEHAVEGAPLDTYRRPDPRVR